MGYKVFTAGEEALASDVNTLLMSQTVARFASAAARSTALTAPVLNQLSVLDSSPGIIWYWTGSAWLAVPQVYERSTDNAYGGAISTTPQEISFFTFTMPYAGAIFLNGIAQCFALAGQPATPMNAIVDVGPTSTPAAVAAPQFIGPTQNASQYYAPIPFAYEWANVAVGTAVNLKLKYSTNASQTTLSHVTANMRIVPGEF